MYSPFPNKKLEGFLYADIEHLQEAAVAEGLYVEYKSELPQSRRKIANSIASFANSYGGWYIVGVKADDSTNTPVAFPGLDLSVYSDPISTVRDTVRHHLDPIPIFFAELVVQDNKGFLIVLVLGDQDKPIISSDGRIYRRDADSSSPVYETDRYAVDRLYGEGKERRNRIARFCVDPREYSKSDSGPWLHIYLVPYPDIVEKPAVVSVEHLKAHLKNIRESVRITYDIYDFSAEVKFAAVQTGYGSVTVRTTSPDLHRNQYTVELLTDGRARIRMPLKWEYVAEKIAPDADNEISLSNVLKTQARESADYLKLVDIGEMLVGIATVLEIYQRWLGIIDGLSEIHYRLEFDNLWRTIPFFESEDWITFVEDCGLPIIYENEISVPRQEGELLSATIKDELPPNWWIGHQACLAMGLSVEQHEDALRCELSKWSKGG